MKVEEFKAWFDGYTEDLVGTPTITQWEKIKKKVSEIDGTSVNTVYIDRWYRDYYGYPWRTYPLVTYCSSSGTSVAPLTATSAYLNVSDTITDNTTDTLSLMYSMGKAERAMENEEAA